MNIVMTVFLTIISMFVIVVEGTVDVNVLGQYTLTYKIKDSKGNERVYTRVVTVVE